MESWLLDQVPVLPAIRVLSVAVGFPALAGSGAPPMVRLYVAMSLCLVLVPLPFSDAHAAQPDLSPVEMLLALPMEIMIGLSIGFTFALVFHMLAVAGDFAGQEMGLNAASQIDPATGRSQPVVARLFEVLGLVIFTEIGGISWLLHTTKASFLAVPSGSYIEFDVIAGTLMDLSIQAINIGITVALPAGVVLLLLTMFTTITARTLPKLHIFDFAFAARMMAAVFLISLLLPRLIPAISNYSVTVTEAILIALEST